MDATRVDVYKITAMREGAIYKTKKVKSVWIELKCRTVEEEKVIAQSHGGDMLAPTTDFRFGLKQLPKEG